MSHPEYLKQLFKKTRCRGVAPCRGSGVSPEKPLFSLFARRLRRRERREKGGGDTPPAPAKGGCPLQSRFSSALRGFERQFKSFGMAHIRSLRNRYQWVRGQPAA